MDSEVPTTPIAVPEAIKHEAPLMTPTNPPQAPPQTPSKLGHLLRWEDVKTSTTVYLGVTALAYMAYGLSIVTFVCQAFIIHICIVRVATLAEGMGLKQASVLTSVPKPSSKTLRSVANDVVDRFDKAMSCYEEILATAEYTHLAAVIFGLYTVAKVFQVLSLPVVLFLAFQAAFIVTPIYTNNQSQCDDLMAKAGEMVRTKAVEPATKKLTEVSDQISVAATPYKEKVLAFVGRSPTNKDE